VFPPGVCVRQGRQADAQLGVLLLPFMGRDDIYRKYDFGEPWNGPHNRLLESEDAGMVHLPDRGEGGRKPRPSDQLRRSDGARDGMARLQVPPAEELTAGTSRTILLVEVADSDIHWMEPRDPEVRGSGRIAGGSCEPFTSHHVAESTGSILSPEVGTWRWPTARYTSFVAGFSIDDAKSLLTSAVVAPSISRVRRADAAGRQAPLDHVNRSAAVLSLVCRAIVAWP